MLAAVALAVWPARSEHTPTAVWPKPARSTVTVTVGAGGPDSASLHATVTTT